MSIRPSSAMLMTPARSLSNPPSAAKISGVETLQVEARSCEIMARGGACVVAQVSNLCTPKAFGAGRRFPIGRTPERSGARASAGDLQVGNLRYFGCGFATPSPRLYALGTDASCFLVLLLQMR